MSEDKGIPTEQSTGVSAIELNGLTKTYGQYNAVNNLTLSVPQGRVLGFLGPNGAGKTTLIRMLLGLVFPTRGQARVLGYDILTQKDKILPLVGAVVETPTFYNYLSAYDNLKVIASTGGLDPSRIGEVLDLVQLTPRAKEKVKTYSLGMRQRLGIAACLLNNPRLVFLDEPTNGLDPQGTVDVRNLIVRLGQLGHTVFVTSHLLNEIEYTCNYIVIIQRGTLLVEGDLQQLLAAGRGRVIIEVDQPEYAVQVLNQQFGPVARPVAPMTLELQLNRPQIPAAIKLLAGANSQIYSVAPQRSSLEEYFIGITSDSANPFDRSVQPGR